MNRLAGTDRSALAILKENTKERLAKEGIDCDKKTLRNAINKARIWAIHAYGKGGHWLEYLCECEDFFVQVQECLQLPNSPKTFNNQVKAKS